MNQSILLFGLFLFAGAFSNSLFPQSAKYSNSFQHYSIENGLSNNVVNCVVQDDRGFIWIGTENGLNQFDGISSKVYRQQNSNESSGFSRQECAFKDSKSRLWFGGNGLLQYKPERNTFVYFSQNPDDPRSIGTNDITDILEDENGTIWVGTRQGLFKYHETTNDFSEYLHDTIGTRIEVYNKNRIIDMVADFKGSIWIATLSGLYQFSVIDGLFISHHQAPLENNAGYADKITGLTLDGNGKLWASIDGAGIWIFDSALKLFTPPEILPPGSEDSFKSVRNMHTSTKKEIWIATSFDGVYVYNQTEKKWRNYRHDPWDPLGLIDNKTTTIFEDKAGMIWIGTAGRGADRISMVPQKFSVFLKEPGKPGGMCENDITCSCKDQSGNLWLGSKNGLVYYDRVRQRFTCFRRNPHDKNSLINNDIRAIDIDQEGNLWVGTSNGLNCFNPARRIWKNYVHNTDDLHSLPANNIYSLLVRKNNEVWVGTSRGIAIFNRKENNFESQFTNPAIDKFTKEFYTSVFEDSNQNIWLSTSRSGIMQIDDQFNVLEKFNISTGWTANKTFQFSEDSGGNIWMATDNGLLCWSLRQRKFISSENEWKELKGTIYDVVCVNDTLLWISTSEGLAKVDLRSIGKIREVTRFNVSDGLQSNAFAPASGRLLNNKELLFGGINGFNIFYPERIQYNSFIPEVYMDYFTADSLTLSLNEIIAMDSTIVLSHSNNSFSFGMTSLNFDHPEKNQFAFQLEGFDGDINYNGSNRTGSYTNIPPGNYILKIIASNNDGIWNQKGTRIKIHIIPPFWQSGSFIFATVLTTIVFLYLIFKIRVNWVRDKQKMSVEVNRKVAEARMAALRSQMNPHFIFNSLNSIQHFISESQKDNALKYLSKFSRLIRIVLQNAERNSNTIADEIKMLEYYLELEALRFSDKFTYHINVDDKVNIHNTEIPSMILQPFIENAIIHGLLNRNGEGILEISILKKGEQIICTIEDNGIGREAAEKIKKNKLIFHESMGTRVAEERIQMMGGANNRLTKIKIEDLKNENNVATGTRVTIEIEISTGL